MLSEIAQRERAENRIGERVQQDVRIRMAEQAARVRNRHATDDERATRD